MKNESSREKLRRFFQKNTSQSFYLRQIAQKLKVDPGNASRILNSLVDKGYLTKLKKGNMVYFSSSKRKAEVEDEDLGKRVNKWLKDHKKDYVKLVQTLIQTSSVSGEDPEDRIAEHIYYKVVEMGLKVEVVFKDKRRPNMVIQLEEQQNKKMNNFLLLGHLDTVGVSDLEDWRYYPFSGHKSGGRVYGRGAIDMKAGIVCELFTLKLIQDLGINLPVNPRILLVSNEEGGSTASPIFDVGMEFLIEEGLVEGVGAIYGYGGSYNVGIGHRGVLRIRIVVNGEAFHTGSVKWQEQSKGVNAVTAMAEILLKLENMKLPRTKHSGFPKHSNIITPGTMILHGGTAVSMVPEKCESVVEVRYLPGLKIRKVYSAIKEIVEKIAKKRGVRVDLRKFVDIPAVCLSPQDEVVKLVKDSVDNVYKQPVSVRGCGPANESFMLIQKGIPTVIFGPIGAHAHADNEFVDIKSLAKTVKVYLNVLQNAECLC
ncbi:MAG: M20/M25/M40 family metallo-hydrolase [Patescibacteria group bacterium]|nr:M20/M25/M40 family metallo-hydrolase [Patescibacteria group bacterium]